MPLKGNQPKLAAALAEHLDLHGSPPIHLRDHGHGRDEHRSISVAPITPEHGLPHFPGARQAIRIVYDATDTHGNTIGEVATLITSLDPSQADPIRLATLVRGHWGIENRSHWRRDAVYGEDCCRARTRHQPINLAALRNLVIATISLRRPARFNRLRNAIAGSLAAVLALLGLGAPVHMGHF